MTVPPTSAAPGPSPGPEPLRDQVERVERRAIRYALSLTEGNRRKAAAVLGISLRTLFYKLRKLEITWE